MPKSNLQRVTLPALTGGVSTQPEGQRFPNQTTEAINVNLDLVRGLEKRDGTRLETLLDFTGVGTLLSIQWVQRDDDEHYVILCADNGLHIYNITDGVKATVTVDAAVDSAYLNGITSALTVADTTYLVNSSVTVLTDPTEITTYSRDTSVTPAVADWNALAVPSSTGIFRYVEGDIPSHPAGFYSAISVTAVPYWERVATPEANSNYLATTMPIRLRNTGLNTFEVDNPEWTPRLDGDSDTNPPATFVNQKITEMTFYAGRLWIVAGQSFVGSRTDDLLNYWVDDIANLNDADLIDLQVGADTASGITHVLPYSNTVLIFTGANRQYELTSGSSGVVSPSTVSLRETTAYPQPSAAPARLGSYLYFPTSGGGSTRLYEYILTDGSVPSTANDVLSHTFGYLPDDVTEMVSISQTDQIFMRCASTQDIFVYQQAWNGVEKIQNALFRWQLASADDTILAMDAVGSILYVLIERAGDTPSLRVESVYTARASDDVNQDDFSYPISLDGKQTLIGNFDPNTGLTTWTSALSSELIPLGVLGDGWRNFAVYSRQAADTVTVDRSGSFVEVTAASPTTFTAPGDYSFAPVIFGRTVNMNVLLSQLHVRDEQGMPVVGTFQLKKMFVYHQNTGYFAVEITPPGRSTRTKEYTSKQIGLFTFNQNEQQIAGDGMYPVMVMSSAAGVKVALTSDNPAPVNIPYIETIGGFVPSKSSTTNYR